MFSHTNPLVGRRFTASIGEPWDFVSSVGQNRLEGEIAAVVLSDHGQPLFLCSVSPFTISGGTIRQVIGANRYIGSQELIKTLESGENAVMNFAFLTSGDVIAQEDVVKLLSESTLAKFLVGSMKLSW